MMLRALLAAGLLALAGPATAWARDFTVALQAGGPVQALRQVYLAPFAATGAKVDAVTRPAGPDALRAGAAGWDVVEVSGADAAAGLSGRRAGKARLGGAGRARPHAAAGRHRLRPGRLRRTPPCCPGTAPSSRARRPGRISGTSPRCRASAACAARRAARWRSRCSPTAWRPAMCTARCAATTAWSAPSAGSTSSRPISSGGRRAGATRCICSAPARC